MRERVFPDAHKFVAVDTAGVLQTFVDTDIDLGMNAIPARVDGSANHRGETGGRKELPAYDDEDPLFARVMD